jgi:hypothetical protein
MSCVYCDDIRKKRYVTGGERDAVNVTDGFLPQVYPAHDVNAAWKPLPISSASWCFFFVYYFCLRYVKVAIQTT